MTEREAWSRAAAERRKERISFRRYNSAADGFDCLHKSVELGETWEKYIDQLSKIYPLLAANQEALWMTAIISIYTLYIFSVLFLCLSFTWRLRSAKLHNKKKKGTPIYIRPFFMTWDCSVRVAGLYSFICKRKVILRVFYILSQEAACTQFPERLSFFF